MVLRHFCDDDDDDNNSDDDKVMFLFHSGVVGATCHVVFGRRHFLRVISKFLASLGQRSATLPPRQGSRLTDDTVVTSRQ